MVRKLLINGQTLSITEAARLYKIGAGTISARLNKLGWTVEEAVGITHRSPQDRKAITFRGNVYTSQEDFVKGIAATSPFAEVTLKIKLAKLNKQKGTQISEKDLEDLVSGANKFQTEGGWLYLIHCLPLKKSYIGISVRDPLERWKAHVSEAYFSNSNSPLKTAIRTHGESSFQVSTLGFYKTNKELKQAEKDEIERQNTFTPHGLNANRGGTLGALDVQPIQFKGSNFRSISEIARHYKIKAATLRQRIQGYGMTLDEAISFTEDLSVTHNGINYTSKRKLCEALKIPYQRLIGLMHQGQSIESAIKRITGTTNCLICGAAFSPKSSLNKYCSQQCKFQAQYERIKTPSESNPNKRLVTFQGKQYESVSELARSINIPRSQLSKAIHKFGTADEAVAKLKNA